MLVKTCDIARKEYVPEDLKTAKYAFIRIDTFKPPPPTLSSLLGTTPHTTAQRECLSADSGQENHLGLHRQIKTSLYPRLRPTPLGSLSGAGGKSTVL